MSLAIPTTRAHLPAVLLGLVLWASAGSAQQRGSYLPISDPATAVAEQLITRGVLTGFDGAARPFEFTTLRSALATVDTIGLSSGDRARIRWLREAVGSELPENRWEATLAPDLGFEAGTQPRRQLLLPEGEGDVWAPLIRVRLGAEFGPFSLQFEPQKDPRRRVDPDWRDNAPPDAATWVPGTLAGLRPGFASARSASEIFAVGAMRLPVALIRGEWRWFSVEWGELERNWGPPGVPGLMVSPLGYHRPELGVTLGPDAFRFEWRTAPLSDGVSSTTGNPVARWWTMHRLRWRPSHRLQLAIWETSLNAEEGGPDRARWAPFNLLSRGNRIGLGDDRNASIGLDASWRALPALLLEGQFLLDDLIWEDADENPYPHRFGFTFQARGPLGGSASWRSYFTGLSGLALNARKPEEAYLDDGVGMGRLRPDHLEAGASVSVPWGFSHAGGPGEGLLGLGLAAVGVRWRRQGIRRFTDPFPDLERGPGVEKYPTWSPEIEREVWALVNEVDAELGPFTVQWEGHLQHRRFPVSGEPAQWGFEALVTVLWRLGTWRFGGEG